MSRLTFSQKLQAARKPLKAAPVEIKEEKKAPAKKKVAEKKTKAKKTKA